MQEHHKKALEKLTDYIAGFLSNLAVVSVGLAIFKQDEVVMTLLVSGAAFLCGAIARLFKRK